MSEWYHKKCSICNKFIFIYERHPNKNNYCKLATNVEGYSPLEKLKDE